MNEPAPDAAASVPSPRSRPIFLRRKIILGVSAGFVFILLVALCLSPREQLYDGKTVREWFDVAVNSTNFPARTQAMEKLHSIGAPVVPFLVTRLERSDSLWEQRYERFWLKSPASVRARLPMPRPSRVEQAAAIAFLGEMGPVARPAVPALLRLLETPPTTNSSRMPILMPRLNARAPSIPVSTLLSNVPRLPPAPPAGIPTRTMLTYTMSTDVNDGALQVLAVIAPEEPALLAFMLSRTNRNERAMQRQIDELIRLPTLAPAILKSKPLLRSTLETGNAQQRQWVLKACSVVITKSPDLHDLVLRGLRDTEPQVQAWALVMVSSIEAPDEVVASAVVGALAGRAISLYNYSGPFIPQDANLDKLRRIAKSEDAFTVDPACRMAVEVLKILPRNEVLYRALEKGLDHENSRVRAGCVMMMGELKEQLPRFQPLIEQRLKDESLVVQYQAALALWNVARVKEPLVPFMLQKLQLADEGQRWNAAVYLESGPVGRADILRALEERVQKDSSFRIRARSATALGVVGAGDSTTLAVLSKAAKEDEYVTVRDAASEALAKLQSAPMGKER